MRSSTPLFILSATSTLAALTPTWAKLALSLNLMEANLNTDRSRIDKHYIDASKRAADNNALNTTQGVVADALLTKLMAANAMQIKALSDLRSYLFYPESNPEEYYGAAKRGVESIDFGLPEGLLETQGVFNDKDEVRAVSDIPGCATCVVDW
ncbi:uncharacterized protein F4807DRAFT_460486 [Annulohypoxylon truncatum]|uniref:uncharacterized protein n=1 Tax=Annulohypoxylon truncatum TaxID=327061 RepID=UPI0020083CF6|nr:uncharacterized protein F4807DRAFT_460486 [Annulohypoxylon truncatum]KAI1209741.1 hypothetical protein F4807DRAFT_460486 [Annulohypoxylon truncatum]